MTARSKLLIINGPNLNLLGKREPEIYGAQTLPMLNQELSKYAESKQLDIEFFQSNSEGALIDEIHRAFERIDFIIINPAAYTHTSVAIRDALLSVNVPFIEVHLSNVHAREPFRHHSYLSDVAQGVICGLGSKGYFFALDAAASALSENQSNN